MKRHANLAHLSREHHQVLILAQLLKSDAPEYPRLPKTVPGKLGYAHEVYTNVLRPHMDREEQLLFPMLSGLHNEIDQMIYQLQDDHTEIEIAFQRLEADANVITAMDSLGHLLADHVRKEEREFFELIQEKVPEALAALGDKMASDEA